MDWPSSYNITFELKELVKDRRVWIIAGSVGALILIAVIWFFLLPRGATSTLKETNRLAQELQSCAPGNTTCQQLTTWRGAVSSGTTTLCQSLSAEARETCIWATATERADPELCGELSTREDRPRCKDTTLMHKLLADVSSVSCSQFEDEIVRGRCEVLKGETDACVAVAEVERAACLNQSKLEAAESVQTREACLSLDVSVQDACLRFIGEQDDDGDGLTFRQEEAVGTSDQSADTDKDGFADDDEVAHGYNPLGPGKASVIK